MKTLYIPIPCNEELPEKEDIYNTSMGEAYFNVKLQTWAVIGSTNTKPIYWLKPVLESNFAHSLRLLRDLRDLQNGAPLETERNEWEEVMAQIYEFLNKYEK